VLREQLRRTSELVVAQRLPEAELELLRAQADAPHDLRVLKLLALVRFKLGRLSEARQIYREAAQIAPDDAAIRLNLGLIALKLDWFDEAVTELETTVRLRPEDRRAWSYLGYACARTGARAQAAAAFRRAGQHELAAEMERVVSTPASPSEGQGGGTGESETAADSGPATPRPEVRTQVLDAVVAPTSQTPSSGQIVSLADFALARLLEPAPEPAAMAWLGHGVVRFAASNETYVRESALLAARGGVDLLPARRRMRGHLLGETLTSQGERFLRLAGDGDLWLCPWRAGRALFALSLERDVLYMRDDNVAAWGDELIWEWGRVPGGGPPLLQFRGTGRVVVSAGLDEVVAVRLGEGDTLAVLGRRLAGWVGRVVAQSVARKENDPGDAYVTCSGVGVVLLGKHGEPTQSDNGSAQRRDDGAGADRPGGAVLHR